MSWADVADMRALALGQRFDGIIAWDSLFHLSARDQRRMFSIFAAHAAPGAALMFNSGAAAGEQIGIYHGDPLYHASLDPSEYQLLLNDNDFDILRHVVSDPECGQRTIWLARSTLSEICDQRSSVGLVNFPHTLLLLCPPARMGPITLHSAARSWVLGHAAIGPRICTAGTRPRNALPRTREA